MLNQMNEIYALDWAGQEGILEEISCGMAEQLINQQMPFCIVDIQKDNHVCFEAATEYDAEGLTLNISERCGEVTDQMKQMQVSHLFYHEDFANDGYLVHLNFGTEKSLFEQIGKEMDISRLRYYLWGKKEMSDILKLPEGVCLMIDCGSFMQRIQETSKNLQERNTDNRHR